MGPSDPGSATERASAAPSTFSVVIPAFNEEEAIRLVLERVLSLRGRLADVGIDGPEVIVVDDGSSDRTAEIAGGMPDVQVIRHATNRGYGAALKSGIGAARGDLIAFLDADGTYPPEHFPDLCRAVLRGADVVVGSRMGGGAQNGMPLGRRIGNRAFGALVTLLGTERVRDSASGMRVLRRAALERLDPLPDGLNFTPIMSLRAMHEGLQLVEVPIPYAPRVGASKLHVVRDGLRYLHSIVWTALGYNPVRVCGGLGLLGVLTALLVFGGLATVRASGVAVLGPFGVAAVFVALVAGVGGVSLFCLGATFNYLLALLRREPIRYGIFGAPLFARPLERHFGWVGLLLAVAGAGGAAVSLLLGSYGWSIERLWLYLVGSALVILVGGQLVVSWILMQVLGEVSARRGGAMSTDGTSNRGAHRVVRLPAARFPDADAVVRRTGVGGAPSGVDVLLVNPPSPDGGIWIRTQHRVGRRSRENMIWPQVSLAQLAALLVPDYSVEIVDAIALRMGWPAFTALLRARRPRYYLTQVTAPTLTNDMYGAFLARSVGAVTMGFGTHVTPLARETLRGFPALDYVLRGEPELTLRELIDTLETALGRWRATDDGRLVDAASGAPPAGHALMWPLWTAADPSWQPAWAGDGLAAVKGLGWRRAGEITLNPDRPFVRSLDDLPMPLHHLLPFDRYRMPMIKGPYSFIVTSRGCPAGCTYCIKHVSYQYAVRLRSPAKLVEEMQLLHRLGVGHIHMYADLFTVNRDQVVELCRLIIESGLRVTWTANSRVDYVDADMLRLMGRAGCMLMAWGIESGNELILKRAHKGATTAQAHRALGWAHAAGIKNWGYFIIGLPGETVETIRETIAVSKALPLDIALFHVAAPYPGTPFFSEVVEHGWFRPGTNWEEVDMDQDTVLDYPGLRAEDLLYWQKRAFREWAFRPGPLWTFLKSMNSWHGLKSGVDIGLQTLGWVRG